MFRTICLSLLMFSFVQSARSEPLICQDPIKVICEKPTQDVSEEIAKGISLKAAKQVNWFLREHYSLEGYSESLRKELNERPLKYGLAGTRQTIVRALLYMGCSEYLSKAYYAGEVNPPSCFLKRRNRNVKISFKNLLKELPDASAFPKAEQTIQEAKDLVTEVFAEGVMDIGLKSKILARIKKTDSLSVTHYLHSVISQIDHRAATHVPHLLEGLVEACDFDDSSINAFNYSDEDGAQLVVCPSLWISSMGDLHQSDSSSVMSVLLHEMGHSIEGAISLWHLTKQNTDPQLAELAQGTFQKTLSCMNEKYVKTHELYASLPGKKGSAERRRFRLKMDFNPAKKMADLFYPEYSADAISAKAMARYLERTASLEGRSEIMKRNLEFLCGSDEHDSIEEPLLRNNSLHPSGTFRIQQIFLSTPELRSALGCESQSAKNTCSLF